MIAIKRSSKRPIGGRFRMVSKPQSRAVSKEEGSRILDRQARKYLEMSGHDFKAQYQSGKIKDSDRPNVARVAALIPFSED